MWITCFSNAPLTPLAYCIAFLMSDLTKDKLLTHFNADPHFLHVSIGRPSSPKPSNELANENIKGHQKSQKTSLTAPYALPQTAPSGNDWRKHLSSHLRHSAQSLVAHMKKLVFRYAVVLPLSHANKEP
jgi:hypothetical protein